MYQINCMSWAVHNVLYKGCPQVMDAPAKLKNKQPTRPYVVTETGVIAKRIDLNIGGGFFATPLSTKPANHPYCFRIQYEKQDGSKVEARLNISKLLWIPDKSFLRKSPNLPQSEFNFLKKKEQDILKAMQDYIKLYWWTREKEKSGQALTNREQNLLRFGTIQYFEDVFA